MIPPEASARNGRPAASLNRLALSATTHCLTGCAIGEVLPRGGWHRGPPGEPLARRAGRGHAVIHGHHGHH
jgi:hypothetical protein